MSYAFLDLPWPTRPGPRPRTPRVLPHVQLDQWPTPEIAEELIERSLRIPDVRSKESRMASPSSIALCLPDHVAAGPRDAFIDDHEFCLIQPFPPSSIHLTLPEAVRDAVVRLGWGEPHPAARAGVMPPTLVMLYAPRTRWELEIIFELVEISSNFAKGAWARIPATTAFTGAL